MPDQPGIVIIGHDGTRHKFPAGFDPKRAAMIVSQHGLAEANATPLKEPSTYWGGVAKAPIAKAAIDALPGVGAMVGGALSTPETLGAGTIPGVALGAAAGRGLRDIIGHISGIDAPTTPLQKAAHIGIEGGLAAGTQAVLPGVVAAAKAPIQTLREASEQFGSAMPESIRRIGRLMPRLPSPPGRTPVVSPDWLSEPPVDSYMPNVSTAADAAPAVAEAGSLPRVKQAIYMKTADGYRLAPAVEGDTLTAGERVNVSTRNGRQMMVTVPEDAASNQPLSDAAKTATGAAAVREETFAELGKRLFGDMKPVPMRIPGDGPVPGANSYRYGVTGSPVTEQLTAPGAPAGPGTPTPANPAIQRLVRDVRDAILSKLGGSSPAK